MPEEIMAIVIVAILSGTITSLVKMTLAYRERTASIHAGLSEPRTRSEAKKQKKGAKGGSTVTTSELEEMLQRAVGQVTDPIVERLERLEERLDVPPALSEKGPRINLDEVLDEHLESRESAMEPVRQRAR